MSIDLVQDTNRNKTRTFLIKCYRDCVRRLQQIRKSRRISNAEEPPSKKTANIETLPTEIWQMIASHLPPASAASLAFSSRFMRHVLGNQYWIALEHNKEEKLRFLWSLQRSLPRHLLCHSCVRFHPRAQPPSGHREETLENSRYSKYAGRECLENEDDVHIVGCERLQWWMVQLVMRYYLFSPAHGISITALRHRCDYHGRRQGSEARIVEGRLLVRTRYLFPVKDKCRVSKKLPIEERVHSQFEGCNHMRWGSKKIKEVCRDLIKRTPRGFSACSNLYRCPWCPSEFLVEIRPRNKFDDSLAKDTPVHRSDTLLAVTRWFDVGMGLTPYSKEWKALSRPWWKRDPPLANLGLPTIRKRFEGPCRHGPEPTSVSWLPKSYSLPP